MFVWNLYAFSVASTRTIRQIASAGKPCGSVRTYASAGLETLDRDTDGLHNADKIVELYAFGAVQWQSVARLQVNFKIVLVRPLGPMVNGHAFEPVERLAMSLESSTSR